MLYIYLLLDVKTESTFPPPPFFFISIFFNRPDFFLAVDFSLQLKLQPRQMMFEAEHSGLHGVASIILHTNEVILISAFIMKYDKV